MLTQVFTPVFRLYIGELNMHRQLNVVKVGPISDLDLVVTWRNSQAY